MTVLVLSGSPEGTAVAAALRAAGAGAVESLAGRVAAPRRSPGTVRVGGFGGADGLARWLEEHRIRTVVDATHPFAARISTKAAQACAATGVALVRLERPPWRAGEGDRWQSVPDLTAAARAVGARGRVFLALGRQELAPFASLEAWCLIRAVTPPAPPLPRLREVVLARGPFGLDEELHLLETHAIEVMVTRNSGGEGAAAKLAAARRRAIDVIMVERPAPVPGVHVVPSVDDAVAWALGRTP